jgi:hypothetical protein
MNRKNSGFYFLLLLLLSSLSYQVVANANDVSGMYLSRNVTFRMMGEKVVLIENRRPGVVTMDEWPQLIFTRANGEVTVGQIIDELRPHFPKGMPQELPIQIKRLVGEMEQAGFISLHSKKRRLPYYLSMPMEQQDLQRSKSEMKADGFIR